MWQRTRLFGDLLELMSSAYVECCPHLPKRGKGTTIIQITVSQKWHFLLENGVIYGMRSIAAR